MGNCQAACCGVTENGEIVDKIDFWINNFGTDQSRTVSWFIF